MSRKNKSSPRNFPNDTHTNDHKTPMVTVNEDNGFFVVVNHDSDVQLRVSADSLATRYPRLKHYSKCIRTLLSFIKVDYNVFSPPYVSPEAYDLMNDVICKSMELYSTSKNVVIDAQGEYFIVRNSLLSAEARVKWTSLNGIKFDTECIDALLKSVGMEYFPHCDIPIITPEAEALIRKTVEVSKLLL